MKNDCEDSLNFGYNDYKTIVLIIILDWCKT